MARFVGDQNVVGFIPESGVYANAKDTTVIWPGMVQTHEVDINTNVKEIRYANTGNRNVSQFVDGALDYDGTLTYFPTDWKFLGYALGSVVSTSGLTSTHALLEVNSASGNAFTSGTLNPFISFTLYEGKRGPATGQNVIQSIQGGIVDSWTLNGTEGEILSIDMTYQAQSGTFSSGAVASVTDPGTRPYLWQDVQVHFPSGTVYQEVKSFSWSVNNNLERRHYLNGSRVAAVPIPTNRDYEFSVTLDATSERTKTLYDTYFLGGNTFNALLYIAASAGSREIAIAMSGCKLMDMTLPSPSDSATPQEQVLTIKPQTCTATVKEALYPYTPW